jgi:hypothetical protein
MTYFNKNFEKFNAGSFRPDPKPEKVIKEKKVYKFKKKPTGEKEVFESIWKERPHKSQIGGEKIEEGTPSNFLHVIPKAKNKYPEYKLLKQNIVIGTWKEHHLWDNDRGKIKDDPKWKFMFELEKQLLEMYKEEHGSH